MTGREIADESESVSSNIPCQSIYDHATGTFQLWNEEFVYGRKPEILPVED